MFYIKIQNFFLQRSLFLGHPKSEKINKFVCGYRRARALFVDGLETGQQQCLHKPLFFLPKLNW